MSAIERGTIKNCNGIDSSHRWGVLERALDVSGQYKCKCPWGTPSELVDGSVGNVDTNTSVRKFRYQRFNKAIEIRLTWINIGYYKLVMISQYLS